MSIKCKTLYKGDWVDLITPTDKDLAYECLHEKDNVIILPIIGDKVGIRSEFCPPYFIKAIEENYYTVISGGQEDNEDCKDTAIRELEEEAGVKVKKAKLYRLYEKIAFVKNTDMRSSLVLLIISDYIESEAKGDGTENEAKSKTIWVTFEELQAILKKPNIDSLLYFCSYIVEKILKK